jgi:Xaa-Pro aminopeptidase
MDAGRRRNVLIGCRWQSEILSIIRRLFASNPGAAIEIACFRTIFLGLDRLIRYGHPLGQCDDGFECQ